MSHFTVMVIGENPEEQLAPFQENNMGDCPKEYMIFTEDDEGNFDEEMGKKGWWENPNRKWDWFVLGGRWTGFLKFKKAELALNGEQSFLGSPAESGFCDSTTKENIDFDGMRNLKGDDAAKIYDLAIQVIGHLPINKTWNEVCESIPNIDEARATYHDQPRCKAWNSNPRKHDDFGWRDSPDEYLVTRDQYIQNARNAAISTHSIIKDGKWYERGEMGWWGMVHDEKDKNEWNEKVTELLNSISDDTLISIYDCHI